MISVGIDYWFRPCRESDIESIRSELKLLGNQYRRFMKARQERCLALCNILDRTNPGQRKRDTVLVIPKPASFIKSLKKASQLSSPLKAQNWWFSRQQFSQNLSLKGIEFIKRSRNASVI